MIVSLALQTESNLIDGKGGCGDVLGNQSLLSWNMELEDYLGHVGQAFLVCTYVHGATYVSLASILLGYI